MPTAVIAGAGPGLGLSLARCFGASGYAVGLIARRTIALVEYVAALTREGIVAEAATADLSRPADVEQAFATLHSLLGDPDVLVFSPMPDMAAARCRAPGVTAELARMFVESQTLGAINCVRQVLPSMQARHGGTIFLTTGTTAVTPIPSITPLGIAMAGVRSYALALHDDVAHQGVHVCHVCIQIGIGQSNGQARPDSIASTYLRLIGQAATAEVLYSQSG